MGVQLLRNIEVPVGTALPEFNGDNFKIDFRGFHIKVGDTDITEEQLQRNRNTMSMKHRYRIWGWLAVMLLFIGCRQDEIWTGDDPLRMDYLQIEAK